MSEFADKVNNLVNDLKAGKELPEGLDEATQFAVNAERRRRDTQASYTQGQGQIAKLKAENEALAERFATSHKAQVTPEEQERLDELKATDPEAWRIELNAIEQRSKEEAHNTIENLSQAAEVAARKQQLASFLEANPGFELTQDILDTEVPPKFSKELEAGTVTFEQFLTNVHGYLTANKVIAPGEPAPEAPNLSKIGGSSTPDEHAIEQDILSSYNQETY